ncbi:hypothetical protein [Streptomyces collinus]
MLGPYRYHCPQHGTSDPYTFKRAAHDFAEEHRDEFHGGMHPPGECFVSPEFDIRGNSGASSAVIAFVLVMLLAFGSRLI